MAVLDFLYIALNVTPCTPRMHKALNEAAIGRCLTFRVS
ncbi:hypothetical protein Z946_2292 [Sulfitobacter noctilucicola]|nr:hypothetical protein Z946_2292 [Sulfitobacter noctilucicola]